MKIMNNKNENFTFFQQVSRSLNPYQPRAWLRHTPYLRATQTLRLRCRVCAVRTHAVFVVTE